MIVALWGVLAHAGPVPLERDHDLFRGDEGPAPYFRMVERRAATGPVRFDPADAPDATLVTAALVVPVDQRGEVLHLLLAGAGGLESRGIAGEVELTYASGRTQWHKLLVGEHVWPAWAGATGRGAQAIGLGVNAGGDPISASLVSVDLSFPDEILTSITLKSRGNVPFALLGAAVSLAQLAAEVSVDREPGRWVSFPIPSQQPAPLPGAPMNPPIQGALRVVDAHLVEPDGSRARLWGVNLVGPGALPEEAETVATSLANYGFNLVRLHHIDGEDTLLNPLRREAGQPMLDPAALDRFDRMHAALGRAGIRVFAETWTRRSFTEDEGLIGSEGLVTGHKYVAFLWPEWLEAQKTWFRKLYNRVNPHTGLAYKDDPTVGLIELANEQSVLVAWNSGALEKLPKVHRDRLDARWNAWLRARYKNDANVVAAWSGGSRAGLALGETLSLDSIAREPVQRSRTELFPTRRAADLVTFYGELEAAYFGELARFVREELGFTAPIVCTASFGVPLADRQLAACDVVDLHLYWDPAGEANVFADTSIIQSPGRWMEKLGSCQTDKPCTLSELNHTWPNRKSQEAPLFWAALAARQDMDAVIWFAWSHAAWRPNPDGPMGALDLEGRDSTLAQMPVAAAIFRGGVEVAAPTFTRWWSEDGLLRDLSEASSLWLDPMVGWQSWLDRRIRSSFAATPPALSVAPVTPGPLTWTPGAWVGETPSTHWVIGDGQTSVLEPQLSGWIATSLRALDGLPVGSSRDLLLVVAGRTEREGTLWSTGGPNPLVVGKGAARIEVPDGTIRLRLPGRWRATELTPTGADAATLPLQRTSGAWVVRAASLRSPWIRLRRL